MPKVANNTKETQNNLRNNQNQQNYQNYQDQKQKQIIFHFSPNSMSVFTFNPVVFQNIYNLQIQQKLRQTIKRNIIQRELNQNKLKNDENNKDLFITKSSKKNPQKQIIVIDQSSQSQTNKYHFNYNKDQKLIQENCQKNKQKNEQIEKLLEMIDVIKSTTKRMKNQEEIQKLLIQAEKIGNMIKIMKEQQASDFQQANFRSNSQKYKSISNQRNSSIKEEKTNESSLYWFSNNINDLNKYKYNPDIYGYLQWSEEQDLLIQKINANFQQPKMRKQLQCLLKYKNSELIKERFNFLRIQTEFQLQKFLQK